jgi:hypothetical protein
MEDEFLGSHPQKVSLETKHISKYLPKVKKKSSSITTGYGLIIFHVFLH